MATSDSSLIAARDQRHVAVMAYGSSPRVLLFRTATGQLQTTLTCHKKQSDAASHETSTSTSLVLVENVVALLYQQQLIVWDLERGVVAYTIDAKGNQVFEDVVGNTEANMLVLLVVEKKRSFLYEYAATTGKLVRKVKVGKTARRVAVTKDFAVVRHTDCLRIVSMKTGKKVAKCSVSDGSNSLAACDETVACISKGQVVLVHAPTGRQFDTGIASDATTKLQLARFAGDKDDSSDLWLAVDSTRLYRVDTTQQPDYTLELVSTLTLSSEIDRHVVLLDKDSCSTILHQGGQWQVQSIDDWTNADATTNTSSTATLQWNAPMTSTAAESKTSQKRKAASILGPAQAGGEVRSITEGGHDTKKPNLSMEDDEEEEEEEDADAPTIAQRLAKIQQALDDEDDDDDDETLTKNSTTHPHFAPKQATTESLTQLLQQALQSSDDALLELALQVRDATLIRETCTHLSVDDSGRLLTALTARLASKPVRATDLSRWLSTLLGLGRVTNPQLLQPLRNLLQERTQVFGALLQLDGRLSLMTTTTATSGL